MSEPPKFPVALGNVTYLNGEPDQAALSAFADKQLGDADLEAALSTFSAALLKVGRPGQRNNIVIEYGPRLFDLLKAGAFIKRAPWHSHSWFKALNFPIFELHMWGRSGWCAEVREGVMLHCPFGGSDAGLSSQEMACLLSESDQPAQPLVDWLQSILDANCYFITDDVANKMPEPLREHLGLSFWDKSRIVDMWEGGDEDVPLFHATERDRIIVPENF